METKSLDRLLKDAAHWSRRLEEISKALEPHQHQLHMTYEYENVFIVNNWISEFRAVSALLATTIQDIDELQKDKAKRPFSLLRK